MIRHYSKVQTKTSAVGDDLVTAKYWEVVKLIKQAGPKGIKVADVAKAMGSTNKDVLGFIHTVDKDGKFRQVKMKPTSQEDLKTGNFTLYYIGAWSQGEETFKGGPATPKDILDYIRTQGKVPFNKLMHFFQKDQKALEHQLEILAHTGYISPSDAHGDKIWKYTGPKDPSGVKAMLKKISMLEKSAAPMKHDELDSGLTAIEGTLNEVEHSASTLASDVTAGAMKDQYLELLEKGYKPDDVKKYLNDITKPNADPSKVKEPNPKMSALHRDQEAEVDDLIEAIDQELS